MQKLQGYSEKGNSFVMVAGIPATLRPVQGSFPSCTVTVYLAGTLTLASIYSDDAATAKANPFTVASDGGWFAYAANGVYDVRFSGTGITTPFTLGGFSLGTGNAGAQSFAFASLPATKSQDGGNLFSLTDGKRGLWMEKGAKIFSVSGERPNLIEFQADRTGVADCSVAFRAAVVQQQIGYNSISVSGEGQSDSRAAIFLPYGKYRLSADINNGAPVDMLRIIGDNAIIELDAGVVFCTELRYFFYIHGVTIRGGLRHFDIKTGNNECMHVYENCEFMYPSSRIWDIDATSQSTQMLVKKCRLFTNGIDAAQILVGLSGDYIIFDDCYIKPGTLAASAIDVTNTKLFLSRMVGVPVDLHSWVTLRGTGVAGGSLPSLYADPLCRFGGETGGAVVSIVENYAPGLTFQEQLMTSIHLDGCEAYTQGTLVNLHAIPNQVIIENVNGLPGTDPIKVQAAVTAAQLSRIGEISSVFKIQYNGWQYNAYIDPAGAPVIAREGLPLVQDRGILSGTPDIADLLLQSGGNTALYTPSGGSTNATFTTTTDQFAVPIKVLTATADNGTGFYFYTTALNGFAAGVYTAVFDIELTLSTAIKIEFRACNSSYRQFVPTRGRHTVCVPFYYDGTGATGYLPQSIGIDVVSMPNTAVLRWNRFRIYRGRRHISGPSLELLGTARPTDASTAPLLWFRGDKVINSNKQRIGDVNYWMYLQGGLVDMWVCDHKTGTFTMGAAASKVVNDSEFRTDGATWISNVLLMPVDVSAALLMGSAKSLTPAAYSDGVSFTVFTANGVAAAGTEIFRYVLLN